MYAFPCYDCTVLVMAAVFFLHSSRHLGGLKDYKMLFTPHLWLFLLIPPPSHLLFFFFVFESTNNTFFFRWSRDMKEAMTQYLPQCMHSK